MKFFKCNSLIILSLLFILSCSDDEDVAVTGFVEGQITDANTGLALSNVSIIVFDANTNAPVGNVLTSDMEGNYSIELEPGTYFIKLDKQGYNRVPVIGISPIAFNINAGATFEKPVEMFPSSLTNAGFISGKVNVGSDALPGALIVAYDGTNGFSSISDESGDYSIFNVPPGDYTVEAFMINHNSNEINVSVSPDTETSSANLQLSEGASGQVSGQISFLATQNQEVDVALTHPGTGETIPGLITRTSNFVYSITGVPDGLYIGRATYENDTKVVDPDRIVKFGEPTVNVDGSAVELDFDVTGAVSLVGPSNDLSNAQPVSSGVSPVFEWTPYPSTSDYVIEVVNSDGKVIWGGFDTDNLLMTKNVVIPSEQTSITFNSDGKALEDLQPGKIYRWRVYASKDDIQELTGWKLISVSEDQQGLILIE